MVVRGIVPWEGCRTRRPDDVRRAVTRLVPLSLTGADALTQPSRSLSSRLGSCRPPARYRVGASGRGDGEGVVRGVGATWFSAHPYTLSIGEFCHAVSCRAAWEPRSELAKDDHNTAQHNKVDLHAKPKRRAIMRISGRVNSGLVRSRYRRLKAGDSYLLAALLSIPCAVASLGLLSPGAATDGVTTIFSVKKTDDLFLVIASAKWWPVWWWWWLSCPTSFVHLSTVLTKFSHIF